MKHNRIHICGIYGSGKTTLAQRLSHLLHIPYYSLDDLKYIIKYSKVRSVAERVKKVKEICEKKKWITEGNWSNYAKDAFKKADIIILLATPRIVCAYRTLKRFFKREKGELDTILGAFKLIKNINRYYTSNVPVSLAAHQKLIKKHKKKCVIIRSEKELKSFLARLQVSARGGKQ